MWGQNTLGVLVLNVANKTGPLNKPLFKGALIPPFAGGLKVIHGPGVLHLYYFECLKQKDALCRGIVISSQRGVRRFVRKGGDAPHLKVGGPPIDGRGEDNAPKGEQ